VRAHALTREERPRGGRVKAAKRRARGRDVEAADRIIWFLRRVGAPGHSRTPKKRARVNRSQTESRGQPRLPVNCQAAHSRVVASFIAFGPLSRVSVPVIAQPKFAQSRLG
jgi:hypothetical protein